MTRTRLIGILILAAALSIGGPTSCSMTADEADAFVAQMTEQIDEFEARRDAARAEADARIAELRARLGDLPEGSSERRDAEQLLERIERQADELAGIFDEGAEQAREALEEFNAGRNPDGSVGPAAAIRGFATFAPEPARTYILAGVGVLAGFRSFAHRRALKSVGRAFEAAKERQPALADAMKAAAPILRSNRDPLAKLVIDDARGRNVGLLGKIPF